MPLRGRVGRRARTGAHCQNWKSDQEIVIALLNRIPVADGGAGGSLNGRVVAGLASDGLYQAILRFQKQHFPHQRQHAETEVAIREGVNLDETLGCPAIADRPVERHSQTEGLHLWRRQLADAERQQSPLRR